MPFVERLFQKVMELAQLFGRFDVYRVFYAERAGLIARDEPEQADIFVKLFQGKGVGFASIKVVKAAAGKIGNKDIAGQVALRQAGEIILCLRKRFIEVFAF